MYLLRNEESEIPRQARNDNYVKLNLFQLLINLYHVILKRVQNDFTFFLQPSLCKCFLQQQGLHK